MGTQLSVALFQFKENWKVLSDALNCNPVIEAQHFSSALEVLSFCASVPMSLILIRIDSKEDLVQMGFFIRTARKKLRNGSFKVAVLNATGKSQFDNAIYKIGYSEVLDPEITTKALRFKIDFWARTMRGHFKNTSNDLNLNISTHAEDASLDFENVVQLGKRSVPVQHKEWDDFGKLLSTSNKKMAKPSHSEIESGELKSSLALNGVNVNCRLDDFFDNVAYFTCSELPDGESANGEAMINVTFDYNGKNSEISCAGKIKLVETDEEGNSVLGIEIPDVEGESFEKFLEMIQERQTAIDDFLNRAKGTG